MSEPPNRLRTLAGTLGIVGAVIAVKVIVAALGIGQDSTPGVERGDYVLQENDLPETVGGWTRVGFTPAKKSDELARGEYWWTHTWNYQSDSTNAIVSFDQADWVDWHDLTACYRMAGWEMTTREIQSDGDWPYLVVSYERPGAKAELVFSMFYDNGDGVAPAAFEAIGGNAGLMNDLRIRNQNSNVRFSGRAFQCQAFAVVPLEGSTDITPLHLATRESMLKATVFRANTDATVQ